MEPKALKCSGKNIVKNHEQNLNVRAHNFKQEPLECVPRNKNQNLQNQVSKFNNYYSTKEMDAITH